MKLNYKITEIIIFLSLITALAILFNKAVNYEPKYKNAYKIYLDGS